MRTAPLMASDDDSCASETSERSPTKGSTRDVDADYSLGGQWNCSCRYSSGIPDLGQTVIKWRTRYESGGVGGLFDDERFGAPRAITMVRNGALGATLMDCSQNPQT